MKQGSKPRRWSWVLLFTTSGTLVCCAIPITLVSLGMGAAVATMASSAPWLIALSMHKEWIFAASAALIAASIWSVYRPGRSCPTDPELAAACERADTWNRRVVIVSAVMWMFGFLAAYLLPLLA